MENRIYDENNGLWYARQGEYYIPELALPAEEEKSIGIWGQRHLQYLKEHKQLVYLNLLTSGRLNEEQVVAQLQLRNFSISRSAYSQIESGTYNIRISELIALTEIFRSI